MIAFSPDIETASEGIWTGDPDGNTTFVNEAAARALGIDREEMLGRPFSDFIYYDEDAAAMRKELRRSGRPMRHEFRMRRPDGKTLIVIGNLSLLRDDAGEVIGSLAVLNDVTKLKAEHAELRESRERFAQVFEEAPLGMAFLGAGHLVRGHILGANRAFQDVPDDQHPLVNVTHARHVHRPHHLVTPSPCHLVILSG